MSSKLFATRQGTILLGVIAAVIAAITLIVYLNQYKASVNNNAMSTVLVAKRFIAAGTPGGIVKSTGIYTIAHVAKSNLQTGAFVDPASLTGEVAVSDIGQGQQLTAADFGPSTGSLSEQLTENQRAVVIPLGSPQQVGGQIGAGSYVDIWGTVGGRVTDLFQNVYVLGLSGDNVTLRTTPQQAGQMIWASQQDQPWLVLRLTVGSTPKLQPVSGIKAGG
jgi:Flp pilus assembly protein CpaB